MQKIIDFENCSGCHACFNACPQQCITMIPDDEGFLYPHIDNEKCIDCGLCQKVCPILKDYKGNPKGQAYACINNCEETRMKSSSGGIFSLLAENIIYKGGVVFGAAFDKNFNVKHIEVTDVCDLEKLRGSKYMQSIVGVTYQKVREYLQNGEKVLFTGTPCQISGLKSYLGKEYDNLFLQDIICHGVPTSKVWQKYLDYHKSIKKDEIEKVSFRNKTYGWKRYYVLLKFFNKKKYLRMYADDLFMKAFLNDLCLRPSCYNCHSKSVERESDITLADFWGIDKVCPELFDDKGTSLVLVNSEKGRRLFDEIAGQMRYAEVDMQEALKYNPAAYKSVLKNPKREAFFEMIDDVSFDKAIKECCKVPVIKRILRPVKRIIRKVIK